MRITTIIAMLWWKWYRYNRIQHPLQRTTTATASHPTPLIFAEGEEEMSPTPQQQEQSPTGKASAPHPRQCIPPTLTHPRPAVRNRYLHPMVEAAAATVPTITLPTPNSKMAIPTATMFIVTLHPHHCDVVHPREGINTITVIAPTTTTTTTPMGTTMMMPMLSVSDAPKNIYFK